MIELFLFIVSLIAYTLGASWCTMKREHKEWLAEHHGDRKHVTDNLHHEHKRNYGGY